MLGDLFLVELMDDLAEAFACGVVTVDSSDHLGFFLVDDQLVVNKVVAVESVLEEVFTSFHSVLFTEANVLGYRDGFFLCVGFEHGESELGFLVCCIEVFLLEVDGHAEALEVSHIL